MNLPDNTTSKDLWEVCKGYGTVVDVFIPYRKSKAGKRFAFVRFIKVDNVDRLVASSPTMVLDDECVVERDLDNFVMGEVKDFSSINNLRVLLSNKGFQHLRLAYLGGLWVMIELTSVQTKMRFLKHVGVASWFSQLCKAQPDFVSRERIVLIDIEGVLLSLRLGPVGGEVIELEDNKEDCFARKRICIKTKLEDNILEKFKIIVRGKIFVIRAKELFVWSPTFNDNKEVDDYSEDDFVNGAEEINGGIREANSGLDSSIPFPPGFTPEREFQHVDAQEVQGMENSLSKRGSEGGSILEVIDDMIKVGQSMGFTMEGCLGSKAKKYWIKELNNKHKVNFLSVQETKLDCITDMDVKVLWGNYKFEYTISEAVGNSGGILCVWDPSSNHSKRSSMELTFPSLSAVVMVHCRLWAILIKLYAWRIVGVQCTMHKCNEFNSFISNSGLVQIQLEGYSFTWSLQSAKKMSKLDHFFVSDGLLSLFPHFSGICLDRHLTDHRPILLREVVTDYGPSPFRVYHSWFSLQGFDQMVSETWNNIDLDDNNKMVRFKKKLQILKKVIRSWVNDCKKNQSSRLVDLHSKLCHIDKVIDQGVMVDGEWVDDPFRVKEEFHLHFANRFRASATNRCKLNYTFPNRLSSDQLDMLESPISRDEVRNAVWGCGENKSPGPDGFTFEAIEAGIFKGIKIGSSLNISHLFYADDAVFIGEWSIANLSGITHILHCFSLLSGLSINLKKSHLLGVGIRSEDVNAAALYFGMGRYDCVGNGLRTQFWNESLDRDTQLRYVSTNLCFEINKDRKIPRTCSSVADWLRILSGSYAAGGIYHGRPLVTSGLAVQPTSSYPSITIEGLVVLNIVQSLTNLNLNYKAYTEKKLSGILALNYRKNITAAIFKKLVKDYPVS
ncbi:RNA-directed DNA polymerase, eukaryota [Tanacetum coccineum]